MSHNHARAKHAISRAEDRIASLSEDARMRARELLDEAQDRGQRAFDAAKTWTSENSGQALGIAFVVGVLTHAWLSRPKE
jgi:ElaB/YqjD/DUF883 family membrane-anchored ribosome-binding protein